MLRKSMHKDLDNDFVTKAYFKETLAFEFEKFAGMIHRSFLDIQERMVTKTEFNDFKDNTERSFYDLKTDVLDLKDEMGKVKKRLDSIEPKVESFIYMWKEHDDRLGNHEGRLLSLEAVGA